MRARFFLTAGLCLILMTPMGVGEFGQEAGPFAVNVDGEIILPYIPSHWAERHPEITADLTRQLNEIELDLLAAEPLNKLSGLTVFPYYPLLAAEMQRLASEHPEIARLHTVGQSRAGLDLFMLEIADFANPNGTPLAEREVIYLDGGTHSNEYSGVYFTTEWAQFLLDEYTTNETAKWIVENRHTFILPMINPDGSNAFGRINALTVNINRNFPSTWGTVAADQPPLNWGGPYPNSEPETQAVVEVMQEVRPDFVQSTHCCGNLWLHPYGAEQLGHAPDFEMFSNICREVFPDLTVDVERIDCGETWTTIYPASGTTLDEGYGLVGASSWSYEMSGRGAIAPWGQPVVDTDVRQQEIESWRGVMHGFLNAERYGGLPQVEAARVTDEGLVVDVRNQGMGPLHRATLEVAGVKLQLPDLAPLQGGSFLFAVETTEGEVPIEFEWQKRIHPQSNWGRTVDVLEITSDEVLVPEVPEKPSMGDLLPETAGFLNPTPADLKQVTVNGSEARESPGVPLLVLIGALALLGFRRRDTA